MIQPLLDAVTEKQFQASVVRLAHLCGWTTYHTFDSRNSTPGFPDLVMTKPPRLLIVELKREGKRPTKHQAEWLAALRACGVDARVWTPGLWEAEIVPTLKGETP